MRLGGKLAIDTRLISDINADIQAYHRLGLLANHAQELIPKWDALVKEEPKRFIKDDFTVDPEAIANFRNSQIFVPDYPMREVNHFNLRNAIGGERRGINKLLRECLEVLKVAGCTDLLLKYPCDPAGNPHVFKHQGYKYTFRWHKHIYFLALFNRLLSDKLPADFVGLDIGSSYGIYPSLLKKEHPASHHILVDFPEQLVLAHYFLGASVPGAKIGGLKDLDDGAQITREFVQQYDFVLVPVPKYLDIAPGTADLVTNFASFGEMSRTSFEYYVKSPPFLTAKYFLTANRVMSWPDYETDLAVVDYPIWDSEKKIHFAVSPPFSHIYKYDRRYLFFNQRVGYPPYFEYVGGISQDGKTQAD